MNPKVTGTAISFSLSYPTEHERIVSSLEKQLCKLNKISDNMKFVIRSLF